MIGETAESLGWEKLQEEEVKKPAVNRETSVAMNEDLVSFSDCPNKCSGGYIFNPYTHVRTICKFCADKRALATKEDLPDKVSGKNISEILRLPKSYVGQSYNQDAIIPMSVRKDLVIESLNTTMNELRDLMNKISVGTLPETSILVNLGRHGCSNNFIYPFLIKADKAGLTVAPMLTALEVVNMRLEYENGYSKEFEEYLDKQVCVVVIDTGASTTTVRNVRGFMQLRAYKSLPTIIFTDYWGSEISSLTLEPEECSYSYAKLISVEYVQKERETPKEPEQKHVIPTSNGIRNRGATTVSMSDLMGLKNSSGNLGV